MILGKLISIFIYYQLTIKQNRISSRIHC
jgi:hypothetical protein